MVDKMTMRERLARALWFVDAEPHGFRVSQWEGVECKEYYASRIDAILAEMETPSDGMIDAGERHWCEPVPVFRAMILAIRDGK